MTTITIHETPENRRRAREAVERLSTDVYYASPGKKWQVADRLIGAVLAAMAEPRKEPGEWR